MRNRVQQTNHRFAMVYIVSVCAILCMGAFRPYSVGEQEFKQFYCAGASTVSTAPMTVDLTNDTALYPVPISGIKGSKSLSLYNSSTTTTVYYALDSTGIGNLTGSTTQAGTLYPAMGKAFDYMASAFSTRTATGSGPVTVTWEVTW